MAPEPMGDTRRGGGAESSPGSASSELQGRGLPQNASALIDPLTRDSAWAKRTAPAPKPALRRAAVADFDGGQAAMSTPGTTCKSASDRSLAAPLARDVIRDRRRCDRGGIRMTGLELQATAAPPKRLLSRCRHLLKSAPYRIERRGGQLACGGRRGRGTSEPSPCSCDEPQRGCGHEPRRRSHQDLLQTRGSPVREVCAAVAGAKESMQARQIVVV